MFAAVDFSAEPQTETGASDEAFWRMRQAAAAQGGAERGATREALFAPHRVVHAGGLKLNGDPALALEVHIVKELRL